jgi:hypothetical protein
MARKQITAPLGSLTCTVDNTTVQAADVEPGPVVCPTCGRWIGVAIVTKRVELRATA